MTDTGSALHLDRSPGAVSFWIHVTPRARRPGVGATHGDALRVAVREAPTEGEANRACVTALAEALGVRRVEVEIDPGARHRRKRVRIEGDPDTLAPRLHTLAQRPQLR
jgi:uncharacterized protein (TIGR00251 family)